MRRRWNSYLALCLTFIALWLVWRLSLFKTTSWDGDKFKRNPFVKYFFTVPTGDRCVHRRENKFGPIASTITRGLILFYNFPDYYELKDAEGDRIFKSCNSQCALTTDERQFLNAEVIVFFTHNFNFILELWKNGFRKQLGQIWVFFAVESPSYSENSVLQEERWHGLFNWTMTYRYDSELWHGYVQTVKKTNASAQAMDDLSHLVDLQKEEFRLRQAFNTKQKLVAWFVSHCDTQSKRSEYVKELSKYIPVDIYGACGSLVCKDKVMCQNMLAQDYKFSLAFENSICKDYVTEKVLMALDTGNVIPVVRGGAEYSHVFPKNSVINTEDFPTPKALADYLKELANDEDAFLEKLAWHEHYEIKAPFLNLCSICDRLHTQSHLSCVYDNVYEWWSKGACHSPVDL